MTIRGHGKRGRRKKCVVVSVISRKGTQERLHSDQVLNRIIKKAVRPLGFSAFRLDQRPESGEITDSIVEQLASAELVVADVTGLNANVMYEIGIRRAWNLPTVLIGAEGVNLPFDIRGLDIAFYAEPKGKTACERAQRAIRARVRQVFADRGKGRAMASSFLRRVKPVCEAHLAQAICEFGAKTLEHLIGSLEDTVREMRVEIDPSQRNFEMLMGRPLGLFQSRWVTYREMADDLELAGISDLLQRVLRQGDGIIDSWYVLNRWLGTRISSQANLNAAERRIQSIIAASRAARKAARELAHQESLAVLAACAMGGLQ